MDRGVRAMMMLERITAFVLRAPRTVLVVAAFVSIVAAIFGAPVADELGAGGFRDSSAESSRAAELLADKFGQSDQQLLVTISDGRGVRGDVPAARVATDIVDQLARSPHVLNVVSAWSSAPEAAARLVSRDGTSGLIVANLEGGENGAPKFAKALAEELVHDRDGVTVRAGGVAGVYAQVADQSTKDLVMMEVIALPLSFLALVWVFGGVLAAAVPAAVGVFAIVSTTAILRLVTMFADVSVFAMNLSTALGLALAIDYSLLIISRFREELVRADGREEALRRTMVTAGRTVLISAVTVGLSMAVLLVFPMYFMRSFAYAGIATVGFAALATIVVTPAAIVLLGARVDSLDARTAVRRMLGRDIGAKPVEAQFWYRSTKFVMRNAVVCGVGVTVLLVGLGAPFLGVKWGFGDDRLLPGTAQAHQVGDALRTDYDADFSAQVPIVVADADGLPPGDLGRYAQQLSLVPDVEAVSAPMGTYVKGQFSGAPAAATGAADGSAYLTVISDAPLYSDASDVQLDALHAVPGPEGRETLFGGVAQTNRDSVQSIIGPLPLVLGLIGVVTFVLLFLLTGSVVLPLKALVMNVLSLGATFGALVWVFQDGHLGGLGTDATGTLIANMPVLLFCIAFGLSMDYEVFLLARIRENWLESGRGDADNDESVARGVAATGRVITAAAMIMAISFVGLALSQVSFMRTLGVGLTLAVLMDATLVRLVLVPAFMHLLGKHNWWAPQWLTRVHGRFGISEAAVPVSPLTAASTKAP